MSEWISVKDRISDPYEKVLVRLEHWAGVDTYLAFYDTERGWCDCGGYFDDGTNNDGEPLTYETSGANVTHWMPLPEPPKGELIMSKQGRPADWGGSPLEELGIWAAFQPGAHHKPNIKALKQAVNDLCHLTMQKTAGQKKYAKAGDLSFDDLDGIKWTILIEAVILVLSGKLDGMEDESEDEEDGRS